MLPFSIVSRQASLNRLPNRLSTCVWVVLYIFFLLIFLQKSSLQIWTLSFILLTCPSHSSLRIFITITISWYFYLVLNSSLVLIHHCPLSFVDPYIFLSIFLSNVINIFFILLVSVHVSAPYVTVGLMIIL